MDFPAKDLAEFDAVSPDLSDSLICGRGRLTMSALATFLAKEISAQIPVQTAAKLRVRNATNKCCYIVVDEDENGNLSPTYLTEEEYNALS